MLKSGSSLLGSKKRFIFKNIEKIDYDFGGLWPFSYGDFTNVNSFPLKSGRIINLENIWEEKELNEIEKAEIHSFEWLDCLRSIGEGTQRKLARNLIYYWLNSSFKNKSIYEIKVLSLRLSSWLSNYDFIAKTADSNFRKLFLKKLFKQYIKLRRKAFLLYLQLIIKRLIKQEDNSKYIENLFAVKGIIYGSLAFEKSFPTILIKQLKHIKFKNDLTPAEVFEILKCLLDIRLLAKHFGINTQFEELIAKATLIIKTHRHDDGGLPILKSTFSPNPASIDSVLSYAENSHEYNGEYNFIKLNKKPWSIWVNKNSFKASNKLSPIDFELAYGSKRLILGSEIIIENESFHETKVIKNNHDLFSPLINIYEDGIESSAEWFYCEERFSLTRCFYLNNDDIRVGELISHPFGFAVRLVFYFSADLRIIPMENNNGLILQPKIGPSWNWFFNKDIEYRIEASYNRLINGVILPMASVVLLCSLDEDQSTVRWVMQKTN